MEFIEIKWKHLEKTPLSRCSSVSGTSEIEVNACSGGDIT